MTSTQQQVENFEELPGKLVSLPDFQEKLWEFPPVALLGSKKKRIWIVYAGLTKTNPTKNEKIINGYYKQKDIEFPADLQGFYLTISGTEDGKKILSAPTYVKTGKNLGKKNATNPWTQTLRDAYGKWVKKSENSDYTGFHPPQLVMNLADREKTIKWSEVDYYLQKKYDGIRAIAYFDKFPPTSAQDVIFYSRNRKPFPDKFDKIKQDIYQLYLKNTKKWSKNRRLDGEFYVHGKSLQIISGSTRSSKYSPIDDELTYVIYDTFEVPIEQKKEKTEKYQESFATRWKWLESIFHKYKAKNERICLAPIWKVKTMKEVEDKYEEFIKQGYEGIILRDGTSPYYFSWNSYRNMGVLRKKPTHSDEFEIVGWDKGKGKYADLVVFKVKTKKGEVFSVDPKWKDDFRKEITEKLPKKEPNGRTYFQNNFLGKMATVEYQDKSDKGIPVRAKLVTVRDYE